MKYKKNKWLAWTYLLIILLSPFIISATVEDNFDRTDSTTLGTATNGNTWTETSTEWEIKDNTLYTAGGVNTAMLELSSSNPTRIDYQLYIESTDRLYQRFGDNSGTAVSNYAILLVLNSGPIQYYDGGWTNFPTTFTPSLNTLYNISLRNINYVTHTYNFYVDNVDKGSASFTANTITITHADFDRRDDTGYIDCLTTEGDTCTGSSAVLDVNITSIKANNVAFVNNTEFTTNDIEFNVTYDVINSPSGNFTNSSITNINNALNGDYNVVFEVCYNSTCDTSGNYSYSVNVTTDINFDTINVTLDPSNVTGNYDNLGDISTPTYLSQDNFFINFDVTLENVSTNGNVNTTITIESASSQFITNGLTGNIDWQVPIGDDTYSISFFAENNETNKTTPTYQFIVDTTDPVITEDIPLEINSYELTGVTVTATDTNIDTCYIQIDSINVTCASFTSRTFTTNGNHSYNITAVDLSGNSITETGVLLVNPYQYFRFYDSNSSSYVTNYTFGSYSSIDDYITIPLYDLGIGTHTLRFLKLGYESSYINITFNTTSNINQTYNLTKVRIDFNIYDQENSSLIVGETLTLNIIGDTSLNLTSTTGIFNITTYLIPGEYTAFISSDNYLPDQVTFTFDGLTTLTNNFYLLLRNSTNTGYINIKTYKPDNTLASGIKVTANIWDTLTNTYIQSYQAISDTNGKSVIYVVLNSKIYKFCAEYPTGEVCFPSAGTGQVITETENGETYPILPELIFPSIELTTENVLLTINNNTLTNISDTFYNYYLNYDWDSISGLDVTVCTRLVKNHNYTTESIIDTCSVSSSGNYLNNFILNNSFSYILTIYQKNGLQEIELYTENINGSDSVWDIFKSFNIMPIIAILFVAVMIGVIPLIKNTFLIVTDVVLVFIIAWKYLIPQDLSIITVGVIIVMGVITLWGLSKK